METNEQILNEEVLKDFKRKEGEESAVCLTATCLGCLTIYLFFLFTIWFIGWVF